MVEFGFLSHFESWSSKTTHFFLTSGTKIFYFIFQIGLRLFKKASTTSTASSVIQRAANISLEYSTAFPNSISFTNPEPRTSEPRTFTYIWLCWFTPILKIKIQDIAVDSSYAYYILCRFFWEDSKSTESYINIKMFIDNMKTINYFLAVLSIFS